MTSLDNHKATFKKNKGVLLPDIERHVMRKPTDVELGRDTAHVHPSEMAKKNWCQRHSYFRCLDDTLAGQHEDYSFTVLNAFKNGHDLHAKYQGWLEEMGVLWGMWKCSACKNERFGKSQHGICLARSNCSGRERYAEVPFTDIRHHIWGHADGIVLVDGKYLLIEIKSIGFGTLRYEALGLHDSLMQKLKTPDEVWNSIRKPFPSHEIQIQIYLQLVRECYPELAVDTALVFYEWKATNQAKEFLVRRDDEFIHSLMARAEEVSVAIRSKGASMPSFPSWAAEDVPFCQACDYYQSCYSIETTNGDQTQTTSGVEVQQPRRQIKVQKTTSARRRKALG